MHVNSEKAAREFVAAWRKDCKSSVRRARYFQFALEGATHPGVIEVLRRAIAHETGKRGGSRTHEEKRQ